MLRTLIRAVGLICCTGLISPLIAQTLTGDNFVCVGETTTYEVQNAPPGGISWDLLSPPLPGLVVFVDDVTLTVTWTNATLPATYVLGGELSNGQTLSLAVTVEPEYEIELTADRGIFCRREGGKSCLTHCLYDGSTTFTLSPFPAQAQVAWTSTGAISIGSASGATAVGTYTGGGDFEVTAVITTAAGCQVETTYCGDVETVPDADILTAGYGTSSVIDICQGESLTFDHTQASNDDLNAIWQLSNGVIGTGSPYSYTFDLPGTYQVQLVLETNCQCGRVVDEVTINVAQDPGFEIVCPEIVCAGETASYEVDLSSGQGLTCQDITWTVDPGTAASPTGTSNTITWDNVTNTTIGTITLTPGSNCPGCAQPTVIEVPIIGSEIDITNNSFSCTNSFQNLTVPNLPNVTYSWTILSSTPGSGASLNLATGPSVSVSFTGVGEAEVEVVANYAAGGCSAVGTITVTRAPRITYTFGQSFCVGDDVTLTLDPAFSGAGSVDVTFAGTTTTVNWSQFPYDLNLPVAGFSNIDFSNFVVGSTVLSGCQASQGITVGDSDPVNSIEGPVQVCPGSTYLYGATPTLPGTLDWTVTGGTFANSQNTTTGQSVSVTWNGSGPYVLSVVRITDACPSTPVVLQVVPVGNPPLAIQGNTTPCADSPQSEVYTLTCGGPGACDLGTNFVWSINPAYGSIVSGQNSAEVEVLWHLPSNTSIQPTLEVSFDLCGQPQVVSLPITLQYAQGAGLSIQPDVACVGESLSFTVAPNQNLPVTGVSWIIRDQAGTSYSAFTPGLSYTWDSGAASPEATAGFGSVTALVSYGSGCNFQDRANGSFELLFNPVPSISALGEVKCIDGEPQTSDLLLITSTSAGASSVYFEWEQVCNGVSTIIASGMGLSQLPVVFTPNQNCCYRVSTKRIYQRNGTTYSCGRTSTCYFVPTNCKGKCEGLCPTVKIIDNTGPSGVPDPTCGTIEAFALTEFCNGSPYDPSPSGNGATFGSWQVFPNDGVSGPIASTNPSQIASFSNVPRFFSTFEKPLVYSFVYRIEDGQLCGADNALTEVTVVPEFSFRASCQAGGTGYNLSLFDLSDVVSGGSISNYNWTVERLSDGVNLGSANSANPTIAVPASATNYTVEICLQPTAAQVFVDPGTPYSCQICKTLNLPAQPVDDFTIGQGAVCAGTAFDFSTTSTGGGFLWNFGDGTLSAQANPTKVYATPGSYTVTLTNTNALGCSATTTKTVTVNANNLAGSIDVSLVTPCETSALLSFLPDAGQPGTPPFTYEWSPLLSNASTLLTDQSGQYGVTVTDDLGCAFEAAEETLVLSQAFLGGLSGQTEICESEGLVLSFVGSNDFTYQYSLNGGSNINVNGFSFGVFGTNQLAPGSHTVDVFAQRGGSDCDVRSFTFEVLPRPATPSIEGPFITCAPTWSAIFQTTDGSSVTWQVNGQPAAVGSSITLFTQDAGSSVSAFTPSTNGCSSFGAPSLFLRPAPEPQIAAGCFADCDNLPDQLEDLSGNFFYSSWEWEFVPEGSTTPINCGQPGPGTGPVTPWTTFASCGNGKFRLLTTTTYSDGTVCEAASEELCIICPGDCDFPEWRNRDNACLPAPEGQLYYINYDVNMGGFPTSVRPCLNAITVSNGTFSSGPFLTLEGPPVAPGQTTYSNGNYFNLEGTISFPSGVDPSEVCIKIPYCDGDGCCEKGGPFCGSRVVCLKKDDCNGKPCEGKLVIKRERARCSELPPSGGVHDYVEIALSNITIPIPQGCTPSAIQFFTETGTLAPNSFPNLLIGGNVYDLNGTYDPVTSTFFIPTLAFTWGRYAQDASLACFRFDIKCKKTGYACSYAFCVELDFTCKGDDGFTTPTTATCVDQDNLWTTYDVDVQAAASMDTRTPLGVVDVPAGVVVSKSPVYSHGRVSLQVKTSQPAGAMYVLIGDRTKKRSTQTAVGPDGKTIQQVVPLAEDLRVLMYLPICDDSNSSARLAEETPLPVTAGAAVQTLSVAPNPTQGELLIRSEVELNWATLTVSSLHGSQVVQPQVAQQSDKQGRILLENLPTGLYFVRVRDLNGSLHTKRFVYQP